MSEQRLKLKPKVYLAGFEVFRPDAVELERSMKQLCEMYGFEGISPMDKHIEPQPTKELTAAAIFEGNIKLIEKCDLIIANLNPFRGQEPDSGTVFECGAGYAMNKKLYGHVADGRPLADRLMPDTDRASGLYKDGMRVEDFGLPMNLMLSISATIVTGDLEAALKRAQADLLG